MRSEASRSLQSPPEASRGLQRLPEASGGLERLQRSPEASKGFQGPPEASEAPEGKSRAAAVHLYGVKGKLKSIFGEISNRLINISLEQFRKIGEEP